MVSEHADIGSAIYRVLTANHLNEMWPDPDRREAALERLWLSCNGLLERSDGRPLPVPSRMERAAVDE